MSEPDKAQQPLNLARHMSLAVIVPVILLIVMGGALAWQVTQMSDAARWVQHTHEVVARVNDVNQRVSDKESALRGYLLSRESSLLDAYQHAEPRAALDQALRLTGDNEVQTARLGEVKFLLDQWIAAAERSIVDPQARDNHDELRRRTNLIAQVRTLLDASEKMEEDLLYTREHERDTTDRQAKIWFLVLLGLAAASIAFVSRRQLAVVSNAFTSLVGTERAAKLASREREWLQRGEAVVTSGIVGESSLEEVAAHALTSLIAHTEMQSKCVFTPKTLRKNLFRVPAP